MTYPLSFWIGFHLLIFFFLALDLLVIHRKEKEVTLSSSILWSGFWIALSLGFNAFIYLNKGYDTALLFFTGYVIEKSLSVDNIFVFLFIFSFFRVEKIYQHKILYWGILGALFLRLTLILLGVYALEAFSWTIYILGLFLCYAAIRMAFQSKKPIDLEKNAMYCFVKKMIPLTHEVSRGKFFLPYRGRYYATTLFMTLVMIESADVLFALDSIPAILAITTDPFIVYTSNVFAILGLRSLYFVVAHFQSKLSYFHIGLSAILFFIGLKMLFSLWIKVSTTTSLSVIGAILLLTIGAGLFQNGKKKKLNS